jgi:hypothetical protein
MDEATDARPKNLTRNLGGRPTNEMRVQRKLRKARVTLQLAMLKVLEDDAAPAGTKVQAAMMLEKWAPTGIGSDGSVSNDLAARLTRAEDQLKWLEMQNAPPDSRIA